VDLYIYRLVLILDAWRDALQDSGWVFIVIDDTYGGDRYCGGAPTLTDEGEDLVRNAQRPDGIKRTDMMLIPFKLSEALREPWRQCEQCGHVAHGTQWGTRRSMDGLPHLVCPKCQAEDKTKIVKAGWYVRAILPWLKPNGVPQNVPRPTLTHEYILALAKCPSAYWDHEAIAVPAVTGGTRRMRSTDWYEDSVQATIEYIAAYKKNGRGLLATENGPVSIWQATKGGGLTQHFATFDDALASSIIPAVTSNLGVCSQCGSPWRRSAHDISGTLSAAMRKAYAIDTTGWLPSCGCNANGDDVAWNYKKPVVNSGFLPRKIIPALVADITGGTGSTAVAAINNHRRAIILDLSPKYCQISTHKLSKIRV
jgi:hypothetical protein